MTDRYDIRQDEIGWTVFDIFTGQPVVCTARPQTGLEAIDAETLRTLLNAPAYKGDGRLRQ